MTGKELRTQKMALLVLTQMNDHVTVEPLFENVDKQNILSSIGDPEVVLGFERISVGLR
jgi:hypothetical protein